jgi:serine/threonine protein kinase/tetratricopeptide (TPR) repeat protein
VNELTTGEESAIKSLVARLADEYDEALARGEQPQAEEYARRHPQHAGIIRNLFASLRLLRSGCGRPGESAAADALQPEGPLGDFRLVREVGRGGMGVVYEAVQISLGRRVALKVLPFAAALDGKQLQRFKNEAHAAAQLQHPNIVPVYAVGCERGVHYYAMQFVEGRTLSTLIDELRHRSRPDEATASSVLPAAPAPADRPTQELAASTERPARDPAHFRLAASLGAQAAEAVEHAHQLGVVHRDVKPANLLLDTQGKLWVTDFGLARLASDPGLTLTGDLLGTLRYMSPEQTEPKHTLLDHRTDIYSLGATLYELLTLRPAFDGRERQEVLRQILTEEPEPLRGRNRDIPADLETIVLKALEKSPADRYATAGAMADDLRRFLDDAPIRARRPTPVQRLRRWGRRHQPLVWSATVFGVLLVCLVAAGLVWMAHDQAARDLAAATRRVEVTGEVHDALAQAQRLREQARGSRAAASWTEARAMAKRAEALAESGPVAPELAARVRALLRELAEEENDQQFLAAVDAARLAQAVTDVENNRFDQERALPLYREAFQAYGLRVGDRPVSEAAAWVRARPPAVREAVVTALDDSIALAESLKAQTPEPHLEWLRAVVVAADTDGWRKAYRTAMAEKERDRRRAALEKLAEATDARQVPARLLNLLAIRLRNLGAGASAVLVLRQAQQQYPGDFLVNQQLGMALLNQRPADPAGAVRYLTAAVALRPDSPGAYLNLGLALREQGKLDEAVAASRRAIALAPRYAAAHLNLGIALTKLGKADEALPHLTRAVELAPTVPDARHHRGRAREYLRQWEEAIDDYSEALRLSSGYAEARWRRAYVNSILGRWDKATADLAPAGADPVGPDDDVWFQLACLHLIQNDVPGYRQVCRRLLERIGQTKEGFTWAPWAFLASRTCMIARESAPGPAQGVLWAEQAVATRRTVPWYLHTLALAQYRAGQFEQAVRTSDESLKVAPGWGGAPLNWLVLAMAHQRLEHPTEARAFMDKAAVWRQRATRRPAPRGEPPSVPDVHLNEWLEFHVLWPEAQELLKWASTP